MGRTSVKRDERAGDQLSVDEISDAFDALSPDDKLKLSAIETIKRRGTGFGVGELLNEAFYRALTGVRRCQRDVSFMAFLVEVMRSVASHEREKQRHFVPMTSMPFAGGAEISQSNFPSTGPSAEEVLIQQQDNTAVQAIYAHFEDDPEAQIVLMGWSEGLRGRSLREATKLDQAALDYAAKRIRCRMRAQYPEGWIT